MDIFFCNGALLPLNQLTQLCNRRMTMTLMAAPLVKVKRVFFMANIVVACVAKSRCDSGIDFECSITKNMKARVSYLICVAHTAHSKQQHI